MGQQTILSQKDLKAVEDMVNEAFQEDSKGLLQIDLNIFEKQVDYTLNLCKTKMRVIYHSNSMKVKGLGFKNKTNTGPNRIIMANAYNLIFNFRRFLLDEAINYRYYYHDSDGTIKAISLSENNILKYVKFGKLGMQLNPKLLKDAKDQIDKQYSDAMTKYFNKYIPTKGQATSYFRSLEKYGYIVRSNIMNQYESQNPGLRKKNKQYQIFNQGHIFEALDIAISHQLQLNRQISDSQIKDDVFGSALAYDNIIASQGGDNAYTNTSIKSNQADLYDYQTIYKQLLIIKQIISSGFITTEEYKQKIAKLFLNQAKFDTKEEMEKVAEKALDKLLSVLKN